MRLKYLTSTTNKAGVTYFYLRKDGRRIPLGRGPVDAPGFLKRYDEALESRPQRTRAAAGTIAQACEAYAVSAFFKGYSEGYRKILSRELGRIVEAYPTAKMADLRGRHIQADIDRLEPHPANQRLKTWRLVCAFAVKRGLANEDAARGISRGKLPDSDGHTPWTREDIETFRRRWPNGPKRLAMELLLWTGARTVDAVRLSPSMIGDSGLLTFRQSKTGGEAYVPWRSALPEWATDEFETDRRHLMEHIQSGTFTFMEVRKGRARTVKGMSNLISDGCKAAGLTGISAHGLRKSRLTFIAEAGGPTSAIMAWGGHKSLSEAQRYTSTADRKKVLLGVGSVKQMKAR